jgi:small subunit ribosomal protein S16
MLVIRMRRAGSKNRPFFRVVVTEHSSARDGRFVEVLGHYDPRTKPETLVLDRARLEHWLQAGATPSDTVRTLVARMPPAPVEAEAATAAATAAAPAAPADAAAEQPAS